MESASLTDLMTVDFYSSTIEEYDPTEAVNLWWEGSTAVRRPGQGAYQRREGFKDISKASEMQDKDGEDSDREADTDVMDKLLTFSKEYEIAAEPK